MKFVKKFFRGTKKQAGNQKKKDAQSKKMETSNTSFSTHEDELHKMRETWLTTEDIKAFLLGSCSMLHIIPVELLVR